ncbi:MAG TPA: GNAT family N-acetyltransferase [Vicinamibacterales bacterium]|nr:GNAT family N-acetyltransferase [Vicinamibacterales bacterium]
MPGFVVPDVVMRPARLADLEPLTEIYNYYVLKTTATMDIRPFKPEERRAWFEEHHDTGPHRLIVAEGEGRVLGYACTSKYRNRHGCYQTVETSVYCRPDVVGSGCGSRLYATLFDAIAHEDIHRIVASVGTANASSMRLHERFGFKLVGVFHEIGRKFDRYWDVAWFERPLVVTPETRA